MVGRCEDAGGSGSLGEEGVAHAPLVPVAAGRTADTHLLIANAQQRADLALDPAVDLASGSRTGENEVLHGALRRTTRPHHHVGWMTMRQFEAVQSRQVM